MQKTKLAIALAFIFTFSTLTYSQWYQQSSGVTSQLLSVSFINQTTGFASGFNGKVLRTTNGGINWIVNTITDTTNTYYSIYFTNTTTGYIAGRILLIDSAYVTAFPIIIKTTDGGISWNSILHDSLYTLSSIYFINDNTGFASGGLFSNGQNILLTTTNGGVSWQTSSLGSGYLRSITFKDAVTGYITAYNGNIFSTTNSGANWNLYIHFPELVFTVTFLDNSTGFGVGGNYTAIDSSGNIYRTLNGGSSWDTVYKDHRGIINCVKFVNSNTGFAAGTVDPANPQTAPPSRILKTTNAGSNWFIDTLFTNITGCISMWFTDQNTGYVVGGNGVILKTTTGGNVIGIEQVSSEVPKVFYLAQNYPNPFNPATNIKFALPKSALAKLSIYDVLGREVAVVINQKLSAGTYSVSWDAGNFPSGVYFYKLQSGDFTATKKLVLLK